MRLVNRVQQAWQDDMTCTEEEMARRIIRATAEWFEAQGEEIPDEVWSGRQWAARVLRQEADHGDPMAVRA